MPIPWDLSDFPLANSCGNVMNVCNISGVERGKIRVFGKLSRISIAFSDY
jgi:ribosomal protein S14